tara:strand:- start:335 stop:586 length:252 start_codon:yes stop_codon:yes gene_type:complete
MLPTTKKYEKRIIRPVQVELAKRGWYPAAIAMALGKPRVTINRCLYGETKNPVLRQAICDVVGCTIADLWPDVEDSQSMREAS